MAKVKYQYDSFSWGIIINYQIILTCFRFPPCIIIISHFY